MDFEKACREEDFKIIKSLMFSKIGGELGGELNLDNSPEKGLSIACRYGSVKLADFMISLNANINFGLISACRYGHIDLVEFMISKANGRYIDLNAGFGYACEGGHVDIVKFIISITDNLKYKLDFNMGLKCACRDVHMDIINLMIYRGACGDDYGFACHNCDYGL